MLTKIMKSKHYRKSRRNKRSRHGGNSVTQFLRQRGMWTGLSTSEIANKVIEIKEQHLSKDDEEQAYNEMLNSYNKNELKSNREKILQDIRQKLYHKYEVVPGIYAPSYINQRIVSPSIAESRYDDDFGDIKGSIDSDQTNLDSTPLISTKLYHTMGVRRPIGGRRMQSRKSRRGN